MPVSVSTTWCAGWTATPSCSPRWATRALPEDRPGALHGNPAHLPEYRPRERLAGLRYVTLHPKKDYDRLLMEILEVPGTSIIVFDQTCALEKRRRRKRGLMPESDTRVFINLAVCEGCGHCSTKSNFLSVIPKKTELGFKRQVDQNACNKDFSCLDGFCSGFVIVTGETGVLTVSSILSMTSSWCATRAGTGRTSTWRWWNPSDGTLHSGQDFLYSCRTG